MNTQLRDITGAYRLQITESRWITMPFCNNAQPLGYAVMVVK